MRSVSLGEFCTFIQGGRHKQSGKNFVSEGGFPAFGAGGLNGNLPDAEFERPGIVLSAIGARCGKCFLAKGKWSSLANTQLIFPDARKADVRFLWYQLNDEARWPRHGLAQPFIRPSDVKSHLVYLPPLDEQRRIAAILDKADALRRKRKRAIELLDGLTRSIFLEMFGDPLRDGPRWNRLVPLVRLADIGSGITKGRKLNGSATRSVPYLAVANVQDKALDLSAVKSIDATEGEIARYRLEVDDLLLTEGGDPDKLGRGTLWADEIPEAIHQNHVFRVRVTSDEILPLYLNWLVGSSYGKAYFLRLAKQTTGIASINKTQLSEFPVIVAPMDTQRRFVERAEAVRTAAAQQSLMSKQVESLFSSLQHRAFTGQL